MMSPKALHRYRYAAQVPADFPGGRKYSLPVKFGLITFLFLLVFAFPTSALAGNATLYPNASSYDYSDNPNQAINTTAVGADDTSYDEFGQNDSAVPASTYNNSKYQKFEFTFPSIPSGDPVTGLEFLYIAYTRNCDAKIQIYTGATPTLRAEIPLLEAKSGQDYFAQVDLTQWYQTSASDFDSNFEIRLLVQKTHNSQFYFYTDYVRLYISYGTEWPTAPDGSGTNTTVDGRVKLWDEAYTVHHVIYNPQTPGVLYTYHDTTAGMCYYSLQVERGFNDNVFSDSQAYTGSAGWAGGHGFYDLYESDNARVVITDPTYGDPSNGYILYEFYLGYFGDDGSSSWLAGWYDDEGSGGTLGYGSTNNCGTVTLPDDLTYGTSLLWNYNNSNWATAADTTADYYDEQVPTEYGMPPVYEGGADDNWDSPELGYNFDPDTDYWEFSMIYEWSLPDDCGCGDPDVTNAHNSPSKDAGYNPPYGSIGDYVWEDEDQDGYQDPGEYGMEGILVYLYKEDSPGAGTYSLLRTVQTGARGKYIFEYLDTGTYASGISYYVDLDEASIPTKYVQTTITSENRSHPGNGKTGTEDDPFYITLYPGDAYREADFGYDFDSTHAVISSFGAQAYQGSVVVQWETASEAGTVGFQLHRLDDETGKYVKVNKSLLPALLHEPQGGVYACVDEDAIPGEAYTYKLVEVEAGGKNHTHGPFTVTVEKRERAASDLEPLGPDSFSRKAHDQSAAQKARLEAVKEAKKAAKALRKKRKGPAAKIAVSRSGLYYLDASEIADVLGTSAKEAKEWIQKKRLILSNQGQAVAWLAAEGSAGLYFYGEAIDSIYTNENIYWLEKGKKDEGLEMEGIEGKGPTPVDESESFAASLHVEEDNYPLTGLFDDPESDYWGWDYVFAGYVSRTFTVSAQGAASNGTAHLTVHLKGATDMELDPDHHVVVSLNGTAIGEGCWNGTEGYALDISFDQTLLRDGANSVEVAGLLDTGALYSIFYVDSFDLTYQRYYQAMEDKLLCSGNGNDVVTVAGFTDAEIRVYDVTDPIMPKQVNAVTVDESDGTYRVSFTPVSADALYLAMSLNAAAHCDDIWASVPSSLNQTKNSADYLVIAPLEVKDAAQDLADYRGGKGLNAMVVELEEIYDTFNHGIATPHAVRDFLSYAYHHWKKSPWYVVLAGDATYDYKDNLGYGDNLVPPLLVSTPHGLYASDNQFVDVEGEDGVPEMAIGRLPVGTSQELEALIAKIMAYENASSGAWENKVLMVADNADSAGDFPADSNDVAALVPPEYSVGKIYLSEHPIADARQLLLDGINDGALLLNYIGHGALTRLAQEGMLLTSDVDNLVNGTRLPVMSAMTCTVGRFVIPGHDSLAEALLLKNNGGAAAVWAPTGLSYNPLAKILDEGFFFSLFQDGERVLGEAVLRALEGYGSRGEERYMLDIYNLLGDPGLEIH